MSETDTSLPTVVVPQLHTAVDNTRTTKYTSFTNSISILEFLDSHRNAESVSSSGADGNQLPARSLAPGSIQAKERDDAIIALVHDLEKADPNFAFLSARSEAELKAKNGSTPGDFIRGRKKALESYLKEVEADKDKNGRLEAFYKGKLDAMECVLFAIRFQYYCQLTEPDRVLRFFCYFCHPPAPCSASTPAPPLPPSSSQSQRLTGPPSRRPW